MEYIIVGVVIVAVVVMTVSFVKDSRRARALADEVDNNLNQAEEILGELKDGVGKNQERRLHLLEEQTNHLAKVQMLILKEMGKEHRIEPAKDILVSIGNLSELKKSK